MSESFVASAARRTADSTLVDRRCDVPSQLERELEMTRRQVRDALERLAKAEACVEQHAFLEAEARASAEAATAAAESRCFRHSFQGRAVTRFLPKEILRGGADTVDMALANVLHAAALPKQLALEKINRGFYYVSVVDSPRPRRRVLFLLSSSGLLMVRDGSRTIHPVPFFLSLMEETNADTHGYKSSDTVARKSPLDEFDVVRPCAPAPMPLDEQFSPATATRSNIVQIASSPESLESPHSSESPSSPSLSVPSLTAPWADTREAGAHTVTEPPEPMYSSYLPWRPQKHTRGVDSVRTPIFCVTIDGLVPDDDWHAPIAIPVASVTLSDDHGECRASDCDPTAYTRASQSGQK